MDKIDKALQKLSGKEKAVLRGLLLRLKSGQIADLDVKKLRGREDIFRVRKGAIRIIFQKASKTIKILALERRTSKTYKKKYY